MGREYNSQDKKDGLLDKITKRGITLPPKTKNGNPGIAPLQPPTLAAIKPWGIQRELVVPDCRLQNYGIELNDKGSNPDAAIFTKNWLLHPAQLKSIFG